MKASDLMTAPVVTVTGNTSIRHACQMMINHAVSGMPVVDDDGQVIGVLTEGDLMNRLCSLPPGTSSASAAQDYLKREGWKVSDVMTRGIVATGEDAPIGEIAALMVGRGIKRVLVMREGKLVGVVSRADLLRAMMAEKRGSVRADRDGLRLAISTRIREDAGLRDIEVAIENGVVHLRGTVGSDVERNAAQAAAESVLGPLAIINDLRVMTSRDAPNAPAT
jgi:CBS domain-containing protein